MTDLDNLTRIELYNAILTEVLKDYEEVLQEDKYAISSHYQQAIKRGLGLV